MQSSAEVFEAFLAWIDSLSLICKADLDALLAEFGSVSGVVQKGLYISAYEEIARSIAQNLCRADICNLLRMNADRLLECPGQHYYFVEAMIDEALAQHGGYANDLILASPDQYRDFLKRRFR